MFIREKKNYVSKIIKLGISLNSMKRNQEEVRNNIFIGFIH